MKPVFLEEAISKLRSILSEEGMLVDPLANINDVVDDIELSLKDYNDNSENKILLYGSSGLLVVFSLLTIYMTKTSWPIMFLVMLIGMVLYYRVHEKSLVLENLLRKSKVTPKDPIPKIQYLKSGINLKIGRKETLKIFLSVVVSISVMLVHRTFVDPAFWMNFALLATATITSYFFWRSFYKEDLTGLMQIRDQLNQLESQLILSIPFVK